MFTCNRSPGLPAAGALRPKIATSWIAWLTVRERLALRTPAVGLEPVTTMVKDPTGEGSPAAMLITELNGGRPADGVRLTASPSGHPRTDNSTGTVISPDRLAKIITNSFVPLTS